MTSRLPAPQTASSGTGFFQPRRSVSTPGESCSEKLFQAFGSSAITLNLRNTALTHCLTFACAPRSLRISGGRGTGALEKRLSRVCFRPSVGQLPLTGFFWWCFCLVCAQQRARPWETVFEVTISKTSGREIACSSTSLAGPNPELFLSTAGP